MAADIGANDFALAPSSEATCLGDTHEIDADLGIVSTRVGAVSMRTPTRADSIERAEVVLYQASGTSELLARAVLWPFYGVRVDRWTREPSATASIVIVEGQSALEPVESGFAEDLVRAWFILTDQPLVTHVLVMPREASDEDRQRVRTGLSAISGVARDHRRELWSSIADQTGIEHEVLARVFSNQRFALDAKARGALQALILRGAGGTDYPALTKLPWFG
jgi:predicted solute-binding protein